MVTLYLAVRMLLPLLTFALVAWLLSRLINARAARLPPVPLNLPAHSRSPRRKDRRLYARALRRRPRLRSAIVPASAPRRWYFAGTMVALAALAATVVAMPDGARFQVMVESLRGYPVTMAEVRVPAAAQPVALQRWQPALAPLARPVVMRYPIGRFGGDHEARAVLPVQVRHLDDRLQVAIPSAVDALALQAELARLSGLPANAVSVQQADVAPWADAGWAPLSQR
ncbi:MULTISPECIES: hypothetical protein [Stenotrophomonas]|mgnify:CR=1 FL=1|jgi:hypothetical protein|nr:MULTISPECIES: hypothetical protein [Stenotrophomonas]MBN5026444.1 hypothetical protein [Stenotrophomonas maltophilia]MDH1275399.1 hypothetical protein [Stenotrophomonas sp. GD03937]MDH1486928.1 hypothetical protein [Stenotrophomonas sp. GD03712]UQY94167.1 hypothetical protein LZ605_13530 [Stenotrophomonas maltophilia]WON69156.1 hypothetical protein RWT08_02060 [Stenotrophomonas maltophilia]